MAAAAFFCTSSCIFVQAAAYRMFHPAILRSIAWQSHGQPRTYNRPRLVRRLRLLLVPSISV